MLEKLIKLPEKARQFVIKLPEKARQFVIKEPEVLEKLKKELEVLKKLMKLPEKARQFVIKLPEARQFVIKLPEVRQFVTKLPAKSKLYLRPWNESTNLSSNHLSRLYVRPLKEVEGPGIESIFYAAQ